MILLTTARADGSARPLPAPVPQGLETSSTDPAPDDPFSSALAEPDLVGLHALHSRITRQIESVYVDPAGELDTRQDFLAARHGRNRPEEDQRPTGARLHTEEKR
ncbi:hypothetical protein [Kocuria sp. CPCC 205263]|uniref:hypothetical protein n=1 Tax=Kocuria sp. CPCC 205263 TaxID=3073555 RepID=UPI0034D75DCD